MTSFERNTPLPDLLKASTWGKLQGAVPALAKERELASALTKLEALHKKIDVAELRPKAGKSFADLAELEEAEKKAKATYRANVIPFISQAQEVKKEALSLAKQCQASTQIPKPVTLHVAQIAKAAEDWAETFKDVATLFRPFDVMRKDLVQAGDHQRKMIAPALQALSKGLDACLKNPSRETWDKTCRAHSRAVHNAVKASPQLKETFWDVWKVHDGDAFSHALQMAEKSAGSDPKAQAKLKDVIVKMCRDLEKEAERLEKALR